MRVIAASRVAVLAAVLGCVTNGQERPPGRPQADAPPSRAPPVRTAAGPVFVPPHPALVAPGPEVPPAVARFSGAWAGRWEGAWFDGTPVLLLVLEVRADAARTLLAEGSYQDPTHRPWHEFAMPSVEVAPEPRLVWRDGSVTTYTLRDDDTVHVVLEGAGLHAEATLRRHPVEVLSAAPAGRPFVCPSLRAAVAAIEAEPDPARRRGAVEALLQGPDAAGVPAVGPGATPSERCVTFFWHGEARFVALAGDMNGWSRARDLMARVPGTALFHASFELPADARLEYKLRPDGEWRLDPLNPRTAEGGYGPNSELRLPGYRPPPEAVRVPGVPAGTVEPLRLRSRHLGNGRKAQVYLPPGYAGGASRFPVVYLQDGEDALRFGALDVILDNLIAAKAIPPIIAVLVPPVRRQQEYAGDAAFEAFFVEEVVPAVDAAYRTRGTPAGRVVGGVSLGALAAASLALHHPEVFGGCIAQSGSFRDQLPRLLARAEQRRADGVPPPSFWIDVGAFEEVMDGMDLLEESRRLRDGLRAAGVRQAYLEVPEGHGWPSWRARLGQAIAFTLGGPASRPAPE